MKKGLVLGKFMPFHNGHAGLINFALKHCDELTVLVCATNLEPIPGEIRLHWLETIYPDEARIKPRLLVYDEALLPNTSVSSEDVSQLWANYLMAYLGKIDVFFSSEPYGQYMGRFMNCAYQLYDIDRVFTPVSATVIRKIPFAHWDKMPAIVRSYFVKKICIYGTESTGKSTLTARLAHYFNASYVPEMARHILEKTQECRPEHLQQIARLHAETILKETLQANKLLFVDTDLNITRSYSRFLFGEELVVPHWVDEANCFDMYLYLDKDAPYVQDGTRLSNRERDLLDASHRRELEERSVSYYLLKGNWEQKFEQAIATIKATFNLPGALTQ